MNNLTTDHFFKAAAYIDQNGIPPKRDIRQKGWAVPVNGKNYPPKYILSVALYLSKDNSEICSGKGFITHEALAVLEQFKFKPVEVKKSK